MKSAENFKDLNTRYDMICDTIAAFMYFLTANSSKIVDNPLLSDIDRMIEEENNIHRISADKEIYDIVQTELVQFKNVCQVKCHSFESAKKQKPLLDVDNYIEFVGEIPLIRMQIEAINEYQTMIFSRNQRNVSD